MDAPAVIAPRGHSPLGMSVLERRAACPGSMQAEQGRQDRKTEYAQRGTDLHEIAARCLYTSVDAADLLEDDVDGIDLVQPYLDTVRAAHQRLGGDLHVERQFELQGLSQYFWGTADAVIVAPPTLWVGDLKTGGGHLVPIRRADGSVNIQLGGYALGALQTVPPGVAIAEIELVVVQPRRGEPISTTMSPDEAIDLAGELVNIARAALDPDAPRIAGDHCTFCRASGDCPALRERALKQAEIDFTEALPLPSTLTLEEIGQLLARADIVDVWLSALRNHAKGLADAGHEIPLWKLVNKRGRRVWRDEEEADRQLAKAKLAVGDRYISKLVSPTQAEKALKRLRLRPPAAWDDLVTMTDPGTALVPQADRRPAVPGRPPALDFKHEPEDP